MNLTTELSLARIGNSREVRLPVALIRNHGLEAGVIPHLFLCGPLRFSV